MKAKRVHSQSNQGMQLTRKYLWIEKERWEGQSVATAMFLGVLLMLEVATLLRESNEVGEDHATKADVIERIDRTGLDVLGVVVVQTLLDRVLRKVDAQHRLHVLWHLAHLQPSDLAVKLPHRHFRHSDLTVNHNPSFFPCEFELELPFEM